MSEEMYVTLISSLTQVILGGGLLYGLAWIFSKDFRHKRREKRLAAKAKRDERRASLPLLHLRLKRLRLIVIAIITVGVIGYIFLDDGDGYRVVSFLQYVVMSVTTVSVLYFGSMAVIKIYQWVMVK